MGLFVLLEDIEKKKKHLDGSIFPNVFLTFSWFFFCSLSKEKELFQISQLIKYSH